MRGHGQTRLRHYTVCTVCTTTPTTPHPHPYTPQRKPFSLCEEEPGGGRPGWVTDPCAAGAGGAAHCGAQDRGVPLRADPRCSGAADGEPASGDVPDTSIC